MRATMKIPAVTMVAAWINADMGVGPSMESGSHTCNGTCADFPMAPMNNKIQITVIHCHSPNGDITVSPLAELAVAKTAA